MNYSIIEVFTYIKSDLFRYVGNADFTSLIKQFFVNTAFRYSFWLRLAKVDIKPIRLIAMASHRYMSNKYSMYIPRVAKIGFGLYIGHPSPIFINKTTVIGHNCNISQFLTIGSNNGKAASIGNNVYIGPNVCLVEDVSVDDNVVIGAGSVVVKDIEANMTVAGNPAKIISQKNSSRFILNPWPVS